MKITFAYSPNVSVELVPNEWKDATFLPRIGDEVECSAVFPDTISYLGQMFVKRVIWKDDAHVFILVGP